MTELFSDLGEYAFRMPDIYSIRRRNLDRLLALPRLSRLELEKDRAAFFGLSPSMWSQVKNPDYKIGDEMAAKLAEAAGMGAGWMDSEPPVHHADREVSVKEQVSDYQQPSQNEKLDEVILASAELWVRFEEGAGRRFQPVRRLQRKLEIAGMIEADGGALNPEHSQQLIDAARQGKWDEADSDGGRG